MRLSTWTRAAVALAALCGSVGVGARKMMPMHKLREHQARAASKYVALPREDAVAGGPGTVKNITFSNPKASGASVLPCGCCTPYELAHRILGERLEHPLCRLGHWSELGGSASHQQ